MVAGPGGEGLGPFPRVLEREGTAQARCPPGLRLSPVALAVQNPPFGTFTFGSERVFQPCFAGASADLHPEKLIQH